MAAPDGLAERTSAANSADGTGREKRKPCIFSHPASRRNAACGAVSTPSATTSSDSTWARRMISPTSAAASRSSGIPWMKLRSIFSFWIGSVRR